MQAVVRLHGVLVDQIRERMEAERQKNEDDDMEDEWLAREMEGFKLGDQPDDADWEWEDENECLLEKISLKSIAEKGGNCSDCDVAVRERVRCVRMLRS